ncbi:MAG: LysR family transcriptional regulator [Sphingobium sp.]|nr:LysR family transcriptional regulator [Sphingobium sp.]
MNADQLNIRHLHALTAIITSGGITAAAKIVNLTQPAITQGISKLERQLGVRLFERRPGGMEPTEAAHILSRRAESALSLIGNHRATAAQIRAFIALARAGSYAGASAETGLAEASLHRAISDLSLVMGVKLVDRRGRGIALTPRGTAIARHFRLAMQEITSAIAELAALEGHETGRITIGAMPLSRARILPATITRFHRLYPEVDITVVEGSHSELVGPLRDGDIDMMIGALRPDGAEEGLSEHKLFEDHPIIIARAGHPLSDTEKVDAAMLSQYPWIMSAGSTPLRKLWEQIFPSPTCPPPHVPIECGSVMTIRQILLDSDFLTLLSPDQIAPELGAGWLVRIGDPPERISRSIGVTQRSLWRPTPLQSRFLNLLTEQAAHMEHA